MYADTRTFLALLFAVLTYYMLGKLPGMGFLHRPVLRLWRSSDWAGRCFAAVMVCSLAIHAVSKEPLRGGPGSIALPEWFVSLGYDATDTDSDGIPDCWERWTRTNRQIDDSTLDPDGDGVDNYAEFWHQCDPLLADTYGDGYSDYVEIAGQAVGKTWYDPLVRATYDYEEPDTNANGVPDRWEGTGYVYGFADANGDGLPDGVPFPTAGDGNFDVAVTVTTSRSALLSWGDSVTNGIVLAPCTRQVVRVRLAKAVETDIRLQCGLPDDGSDGLWDASYSVTWATGRSQQTEGNRIRLGDGSVIDIDGGGSVAFRGEVITVPTRGPGGSYPPDPIQLRLKWLHVDCSDGYCWEHDPGGYSAVATYTNVAPPFAWYVDGNSVPWEDGDTLGGGYIWGGWSGLGDWAGVRCVATNGLTHTNILVEGWAYASVGHCPPSTTNIYPITARDGYDVITNHAPTFKLTPNQHGPNCPDSETLDIWAGFAHGGEKPSSRNFETIPTGDVEDDGTSHCHAIDWSSGLEIDLDGYLPGWLLTHKDKLRYRVNGSDIGGSSIKVGAEEPDDLFPEICHAEVCTTNGTTLDRLWIVILNPQTHTEFNTWVSENTTNAAWLQQLPQPPSKITIDADGNASLPSAATSNWNAPEKFPTNNFMHPKAVYELRSKPISDNHGHQATYDAQGCLITEGIKAGTADFVSPSFSFSHGWHPASHRKEDVHPYIRALQLDGNPVRPRNSSGVLSETIPRNLTRPQLHIGPFTQQYLQRRPTTPTGVLSIP